jgi:Zn-finger nucleic acid-binding protein
MLNKIRHNIGVLLDTVGHRRCIKNGCETFCGSSPSEQILFDLKKSLTARLKRDGLRKKETITLAVYQCLHCNHKERVEGNKEDYSEVKVCPKCNGAFVDIWKIGRLMEGKDSLEKELGEARLGLRNLVEEKDNLEKFSSTCP